MATADELERENAALKRDLAMVKHQLSLAYEIREALGWNKYAKLSDMPSHIRQIRQYGLALVEALKTYGYPLSAEAWRNTGDYAPVNAQASREARALHKAAVAFSQQLD
jgi:hypothetical protein